MTNQERIQANNEELQDCIEKATALPEKEIVYDEGREVGYNEGEKAGFQSALSKLDPLTVTENGVYNPQSDKIGFNTVNVNIPSDKKPEQQKSIDITENGTYEITADSGYAISKVTANVNVAASGGGGVETCTVILHTDAMTRLTVLSYSYVDTDGKVKAIFTDYIEGTSGPVRIENVVCGSFLYVSFSAPYSLYVYSDIAKDLQFDPNYGTQYTFWQAPPVAGSTANIYGIDTD